MDGALTGSFLDSIALMSFGFNLLRAFTGAALLFVLLMLYDYLNTEHTWANVRTKIDSDARAAADYYGKRNMGLCILIGLILA